MQGQLRSSAATVADITLITSVMLQTVQQSEKRSRRCTVQHIPAGDIQSGNADGNALSVVLDLLT